MPAVHTPSSRCSTCIFTSFQDGQVMASRRGRPSVRECGQSMMSSTGFRVGSRSEPTAPGRRLGDHFPSCSDVPVSGIRQSGPPGSHSERTRGAAIIGEQVAGVQLPWPCERPATARWGGTQASWRPAQGADRQPHGTRCLEGHHAPRPQRVHLLGRRCQAGHDPRTPHPPDPGRAGGRPASALLLARMHAPRAHRHIAVGAHSPGHAGEDRTEVPDRARGGFQGPLRHDSVETRPRR